MRRNRHSDTPRHRNYDRPRDRARDEVGSALIFALAFLTLFGLLASGLLAFVDAGIRTTEAVRGQAAAVYSAGGAMEVAINAVRSEELALVRPGRGSCPAGGLLAPATNGRPPLRFTCAVTPGTGPNFPIWAPNNPRQAVMGPNSAGAMLGTPGNNAVSLATVPPLQPTPTCGTGWLTTLTPGSYTDDAALNLLTGGLCSNHVVWLSPGPGPTSGTYYFDFASAAAQWKMADPTVTIVAGTPHGWSPSSPSLPAGLAALDHLCATDKDIDVPNVGVLLAFGGQSHVSVSAGRLEVCPTPNPMAQEIALVGLTTAPPSGAPLALHAESGCVVAAVGGCPLLSVAGPPAGTHVSIFGTVVAPRASFALNALSPVLARGVVATGTAPIIGPAGAVGTLADGGEWDATVSVIDASGPRLRAQVTFPTTAPPVISSWVPAI